MYYAPPPPPPPTVETATMEAPAPAPVTAAATALPVKPKTLSERQARRLSRLQRVGTKPVIRRAFSWA
jgi:hypothetical protein